MPKNKKVNGFFIFMKEYMAKEERKGRKINMAQAQNEAGKIWVNMTDQQKGSYNQKAKGESRKPREVEKYTSQGVPLSLIEKEKREKDNEERLMKKEIENTVNSTFVGNELANHKYYFIMVNYFTKNTEGSIYLPAEIALSEYTIRDGVTNRYHSYINPGVGLFGHAFAAMAHSEATHKLPVPPNAIGEKNLGRIFAQILKFIHYDDGDDSTYPPLYTHKESVPIVKAVLNYLSRDGNIDFPELKIYPMHYLFFKLKQATAEIGENKKPASIHITDTILDRDVHEYEREISCDFHEKNDNGKYCALSCVVRWTYTFSENLCNDLAIQMIPDRHGPKNVIQKCISNDIRDDQSVISFNTSTISHMDVTEPKIEHDLCNSSRDINTTTVTTDAFESDVESEDDKKNVKKDNPWAIRNKFKPKSPSCEFNICSVGTGHGRGIIRQENKPTDPSTSAICGYGRGRYFIVNK